jgi:hypothetical protein
MENWKLIETGDGPRVSPNTQIELGNHPAIQLYDLGKDPGETLNVAAENAEKVQELSGRLREVRKAR